MNDLQQFQSLLDQLLQHLGFDSDMIPPDQAIIGLAVDQRFSLTFELVEADSWMMVADLGPSNLHFPETAQFRVLRDCPMALGDWRPMIALDENQHLSCGLLLPLYNIDLPSVLDAFDMLVSTAERILEGSPLHLDAEPEPSPDYVERLLRNLPTNVCTPNGDDGHRTTLF